MRAIVFAVVLAGLELIPKAASAASAADQAAAEALFSEAKSLAAAGDFVHACPKFAESNRLDPGSGTQLYLGACYESLGKLASAWATFKEAEVTARNVGETVRADEAARRANALEGRLPRLTVVVPPAARLAGLELRRDGTLVGEGQWGSAVPVDPGDHTLEATAPGRQPWTRTFSISSGAAPGTTTLEVPMLASGGASARAGFWNGQRIAGATLGAAGLVTLVVSLGFFLSARSSNSESLADCLPGEPAKCSASGVALRNSAYSSADIATGTVIGGSAALAAGVITFLVPSRGGSATVGGFDLRVMPSAGAGAGAVSLSGRW